MPLVTFTVRRGLSTSDKASMSQAMLAAQVAVGYEETDLFHRFLEVEAADLRVDARFPEYKEARTDRFVMVEVVLSAGKNPEIAAQMADEAVKLFEEGLGLAPQDILFVFQEVNPNMPRFPGSRRSSGATSKPKERD